MNSFSDNQTTSIHLKRELHYKKYIYIYITIGNIQSRIAGFSSQCSVTE